MSFADFIEEIKRDSELLLLMKDWLGDELKPVPREQAEGRSHACLHGGKDGMKCPKNVFEGWWDKSKHEVAKVIRGQIALKNKLDLSLPGDKDLAMCSVCGCAAILKPWAPLNHVLKHTSSETLQLFPDWCWITKEARIFKP